MRVVTELRLPAHYMGTRSTGAVLRGRAGSSSSHRIVALLQTDSNLSSDTIEDCGLLRRVSPGAHEHPH